MPRKFKRNRRRGRGRAVHRWGRPSRNSLGVPITGMRGTRVAPPGSRSTFLAAPRGFVPNTKVAKLRYATEFSIDASQTTIGAYVFRANSLYDPESTGIGHSYYMFDQIMLLYRRYRVLGSRIKVWNIWPPGSTTGACYATIIKSASGNTHGAFASTAHILESNIRGNVKIIGSSINDAVLAPGGQKTILTNTYSQKKYFPGILDRQLEAAYDANPELQAFWEVIVFSMGNTNPALMNFRCEIEATALFSEPVIMSESGVNDEGYGLGGTGSHGLVQGTGGIGVTTQFAAGDGGEQGSTGPRGTIW